MSNPNRIVYVQYTNPACLPPLEHSSQLLARTGWQVLFLGTGSFGAADLRFPSHPKVTVKSMPFCPAGWRQKIHYACFTVWVLFWIIRWQPDWIYASDLLACPIAWLLTVLPGQRVIYHEHDGPARNSTSWFLKVCLAARSRLARRAAFCVLPNTVRAKNFCEETGTPNVHCVWNCPTTAEIGSPRAQADGQDVWLLYHGSITPPQLPATILDSLARLPKQLKLRVVGYATIGHQKYVGQLREIALRLGVSDRVEFLGTMPTRTELLEWCRQSDVGLALFAKQGLQPMPGASNKPFDYLARGCALLVSDIPDWRRMYVEPGYALACDPGDPQSIVQALRWFLEHRDEARAMGERGRQRIATEWNYERQFYPVWQRLEAMKT
jgi:glycosyltransferase involved in cell wall biosynthesis